MGPRASALGDKCVLEVQARYAETCYFRMNGWDAKRWIMKRERRDAKYARAVEVTAISVTAKEYPIV